MSLPQPQENKKYTYADYLAWPQDERWEIIDGIAYRMYAPSWQHQAISSEIFGQFYVYLKGNPCRVFAAPFDLRIPEFNEQDEETTTVVQPDIVIICDNKGLKGTGYYGIPTLLIEITSPSSGSTDRLTKFNRYERAGVREYWIVSPDEKCVSIFTLQENGRYGRPETFDREGKVTSEIFPDLIIDLKPVFDSIEM